VYPNPANDFIYIDAQDSSGMHLSLYNVNGIQVLEPSNVVQRLDVSGLPAGVYFLRRVEVSGKMTNYRVIKR
jgi:hypothetical protein